MRFADPFLPKNISMKVLLYSISIILILSSCQGDEYQFRQAQKQFDKGEYEIVIQKLKPLAMKGYQSAETNFIIAESYRLSNRINLAFNNYQTALEKGNSDKMLPYHLAYAAKANGNYEATRKYLSQFIQSKPNKTYRLKSEIELEYLPQIPDLQKKVSPIEIQNLKGNTSQAEFSARKLGEELIISSTQKPETYKNNGLPFVGLYRATLKSPDEIGKMELFSTQIFKENANEGTPAFSKDGNTVVFARGNTGKSKDVSPDVDLYISKKDGSNWSIPERLSISDSLDWDGSPSFSSDGKTLYFSSNRRGGKGGLDLYRVAMDNSGRFGRPINMGSTINTSGDEIFPFVSEDGKLYFSSDGHPSLGGLDLYVATRSDNEIVVEHLGVPMNSISDDFGISMVDENHGYFSSNRPGGKGDDDIYYFTGKGPEDRWWSNEAPPVIAENKDKIVQYKLKTQFIDPNGKAIEGVKFSLRKNGQTIEGGKSDKKGFAPNLELAPNDELDFLSEKEDYLTKRANFSMEGREIPQILLKKDLTDTTFTFQIVMDKPEIGKEITELFEINPIFYDLDKSDIRTDAAEELEKIVQFLKDNEYVSLELGSHTDSRASTAYNNKLSQRRAESAVKYITSRGIAAERMKAKGYGESQLINECADGVDCSEELHQQNRRTEFKIIQIKED
jgi:outer membrane protein OmpA-like peptidoglycan-associated protein